MRFVVVYGMTGRVIMYLGLGVYFACLALWPRGKIARIFKNPQESRLWVRLNGIAGTLWGALGILTDKDLQLLNVSGTGQSVLSALRLFALGLVTGLSIALFTKRAEGCVHTSD